jgi:hypothetical protein
MRYSLKDLSRLLFLLVFLVGCGGPGLRRELRPLSVYHPHVESVDVPTAVRVGEEFLCTLTLSTASQPQMLTNTGAVWIVRDISTHYMLGVEQGSFNPGQFLGLSLIPQEDALAPGNTLTIPLSFESSGNNYIYIGHIADSAKGGLRIAEDVPLPEAYPYPASMPFEYLEVRITVLP